MRSAGNASAIRAKRSEAGAASRSSPSTMEEIEEVGLERQLGAHRVDVELASEPAHGDLERVRAAVVAQRDRLAVEDDALGGKRERGLDHLGDRRR